MSFVWIALFVLVMMLLFLFGVVLYVGGMLLAKCNEALDTEYTMRDMLLLDIPPGVLKDCSRQFFSVSSMIGGGV